MKPSNPKDAVGIAKVNFSALPMQVIAEAAVGMTEGALKYGRHNYRSVGVRASVYFDASMRHMVSWFEGNDIDANSGLSHVTKAICSLMVLRDAMINNMLTDDRPPKGFEHLMEDMNAATGALMAEYPAPPPAETAIESALVQAVALAQELDLP